MSSSKPKHKDLKNTLDLIKISNGDLGVININNMIPVKSNVYELFDLNKNPDNKNEEKRINLLKEQLRCLNKHSIEIRKIYMIYIIMINYQKI